MEHIPDSPDELLRSLGASAELAADYVTRTDFGKGGDGSALSISMQAMKDMPYEQRKALFINEYLNTEREILIIGDSPEARQQLADMAFVHINNVMELRYRDGGIYSNAVVTFAIDAFLSGLSQMVSGMPPDKRLPLATFISSRMLEGIAAVCLNDDP